MNPLTSAPTAPVQVGEHRYQIGILDATKGYPLYCKLAAQLGKVLESGGKLDGGNKADLAVRMLGKALQALSPELIGELVRVFGAASSVEIGGQWHPVQSVFAMHFAGKYGAMMGWLLECVKANFADFLPPNIPALPGLDLGEMLSSSTSPMNIPGS